MYIIFSYGPYCSIGCLQEFSRHPVLGDPLKLSPNIIHAFCFRLQIAAPGVGHLAFSFAGQGSKYGTGFLHSISSIFGGTYLLLVVICVCVCVCVCVCACVCVCVCVCTRKRAKERYMCVLPAEAHIMKHDRAYWCIMMKLHMAFWHMGMVLFYFIPRSVTWFTQYVCLKI